MKDRLVDAGLLAQWNNAVQARDRAEMIRILREVGVELGLAVAMAESVSGRSPSPPPFATKFPALPEEVWQFGEVFCAEFKGWTGFPPSTHWVDLGENIAAALGIVPAFGNAAAGHFAPRLIGPKSVGSWKRIRKRVLDIMTSPGPFHEICILTMDDCQVGKNTDDAFIDITRNTESGFDESHLAVVVSKKYAKSPRDLLDKVGSVISGKIDARWGAAYSFPMSAGADFYTRGTAFKGDEIRNLGLGGVLDDHSLRTCRPAHRSYNFPFSAGYIREVYEINLLSEIHLRAPLLGGTVQQYVESTGRLAASSYIPGTWEWSLAGQELRQARKDWEKSGLVLAAERAPLRLATRH